MKKNYLMLTLAMCGLSFCFAQTTIVLQPGPESGKDALIHGMDSELNANYGTNSQFGASAWTVLGEEAVVRAIIEFDLSALPANAVITNARMSLTAWDSAEGGLLQHSTRSGSNACWLERITSPWNEGTVTWRTQPATTTRNRVEIPESTYPTQNYSDIDVTQLINDIVENPHAGFGFMLKLQSEEYYRTLNFCSSNHPVSAFRPKLEITYTLPVTGQYLVLQPNAVNGKDAVLHGLSGEVDINRGNDLQFVSSAWTFDGEPAVVRSLIEFNLKGIPPRKPIESAKLSLYAWDSTNGFRQHWSASGSNACWLERVISNWDESTVTWNNQPRTTKYNRVSIPESTSATQDYLEIDVTRLVQDIVNQPDSSFGFMLKLQNEFFYRNMNFCSSDHPNAALHPKLEIKFSISTDNEKLSSPGETISVYPNPVNDVLNFELPTGLGSEHATVVLYNKMGQQVIQMELSNGISVMNVHDLYPGIYIYRITDKSNQLLKTGKVVVNN
jgi:hypothetical protein